MVKFTVVVTPVDTVAAFDCVVNPVFETVMVYEPTEIQVVA